MAKKDSKNHHADILRECRTNIPEVIFARFKDDKALVGSTKSLLDSNKKVLVTKCTPNQIKLLRKEFGKKVGKYDEISGTMAIYQTKKRIPIIGSVSVLSAGTSDYFVAEEASFSAEFFGLKVFRHYDCGVAGRKYNDIGMTLYENGTPIGYVSIERLPGSPDKQMAWVPVSIDFSKSYNATVIYTPKDPPNVGGNPVWIYIKSQNGSIKKIHHTFNVQQSMKRDSEHWNHIEPWEVDLSGHFIGFPFEVVSHITDPGSDDETLTYEYGSQVKTVIYLNNPPNPDPYPSPEVNPMDIMDTTTLVYEGPGTVILVVKDDDNVRLGVGEGTDSRSVG